MVHNLELLPLAQQGLGPNRPRRIPLMQRRQMSQNAEPLPKFSEDINPMKPWDKIVTRDPPKYGLWTVPDRPFSTDTIRATAQRAYQDFERTGDSDFYLKAKAQEYYAAKMDSDAGVGGYLPIPRALSEAYARDAIRVRDPISAPIAGPPGIQDSRVRDPIRPPIAGPSGIQDSQVRDPIRAPIAGPSGIQDSRVRDPLSAPIAGTSGVQDSRVRDPLSAPIAGTSGIQDSRVRDPLRAPIAGTSGVQDSRVRDPLRASIAGPSGIQDSRVRDPLRASIAGPSGVQDFPPSGSRSAPPNINPPSPNEVNPVFRDLQRLGAAYTSIGTGNQAKLRLVEGDDPARDLYKGVTYQTHAFDANWIREEAPNEDPFISHISPPKKPAPITGDRPNYALWKEKSLLHRRRPEKFWLQGGLHLHGVGTGTETKSSVLGKLLCKGRTGYRQL